MNITDTIRTHYPNAQPASALAAGWIDLLCTRAAVDPQSILLADSICSDDVNGIQYPAPLRELTGPFRLGGLDGIPFTGPVGMGAYAHHVPTEGAALIWHGPHIGVSADGILGGIVRTGRNKGPESCCGAMVAAVNSAQAPIEPQAAWDDHYQMSAIRRIVSGLDPQSEDPGDRFRLATEAIFRFSDERIAQYVAATGFGVRYVMVAGTIVINTDPDQEMHLEMRSWKLFDTGSKTWEDLMPAGMS